MAYFPWLLFLQPLSSTNTFFSDAKLFHLMDFHKNFICRKISRFTIDFPGYLGISQDTLSRRVSWYHPAFILSSLLCTNRLTQQAWDGQTIHMSKRRNGLWSASGRWLLSPWLSCLMRVASDTWDPGPCQLVYAKVWFMVGALGHSVLVQFLERLETEPLRSVTQSFCVSMTGPQRKPQTSKFRWASLVDNTLCVVTYYSWEN